MDRILISNESVFLFDHIVEEFRTLIQSQFFPLISYIAAMLAPDLYIFLFTGKPCDRIDFFMNLFAALRSLLAVKRKLIVFPNLLTACRDIDPSL